MRHAQTTQARMRGPLSGRPLSRHTQTGFGAREATGGETFLDITAAEIGQASTLLTVEVATEAWLGCPDQATVIVRSEGGDELARRDVPLSSDYPFFGLVSLETPCAGQGQIRLPGVGGSDRVAFEVAFSGEVAAEGPLIEVRDLASQPPPQPTRPGGGIEDKISDTIGAAVRPLLGWGAALGAGYLLFSNLDTISESLKSESSTSN